MQTEGSRLKLFLTLGAIVVSEILLLGCHQATSKMSEAPVAKEAAHTPAAPRANPGVDKALLVLVSAPMGGFSAEVIADAPIIRIRWAKVPGAGSYAVFRNTEPRVPIAWETALSWGTLFGESNEMLDNQARSGSDFYYVVVADPEGDHPIVCAAGECHTSKR